MDSFTAAADSWSIGCIIARMGSLQPLYSSSDGTLKKSAHVIMMRVSTGELSPAIQLERASDVPGNAGLAKLVRECTALDWLERPSPREIIKKIDTIQAADKVNKQRRGSCVPSAARLPASAPTSHAASEPSTKRHKHRDTVPENDEDAGEVFDKYDEEKTGELNQEQLKLVLKYLHLVTKASDFEKVLKKYDKEGKGTLNKSQFTKMVHDLRRFKAARAAKKAAAEEAKAAAAAPDSTERRSTKREGSTAERSTHNTRHTAPDTQEDIDAMFDKYDEEKTGEISSENLSKALKHLHLVTKASDFEKVLKKYDKEGKGSMNRAQFAKLVNDLRRYREKRSERKTRDTRSEHRETEHDHSLVSPSSPPHPTSSRAAVAEEDGGAEEEAVYLALKPGSRSPERGPTRRTSRVSFALPEPSEPSAEPSATAPGVEPDQFRPTIRDFADTSSAPPAVIKRRSSVTRVTTRRPSLSADEGNSLLASPPTPASSSSTLPALAGEEATPTPDRTGVRRTSVTRVTLPDSSEGEPTPERSVTRRPSITRVMPPSAGGSTDGGAGGGESSAGRSVVRRTSVTRVALPTGNEGEPSTSRQPTSAAPPPAATPSPAVRRKSVTRVSLPSPASKEGDWVAKTPTPSTPMSEGDASEDAIAGTSRVLGQPDSRRSRPSGAAARARPSRATKAAEDETVEVASEASMRANRVRI
jgi:Ca2+-binding EF-hand superfamily protein